MALSLEYFFLLYQAVDRCFLTFFLVGATVTNESDLRFLYENHEDFTPFPTIYILPGVMQCMTSDIVATALPPGKEADFSNVSRIFYAEHPPFLLLVKFTILSIKAQSCDL